MILPSCRQYEENEEGLEEKLNTVEEELESYGVKMNKTKIIVCWEGNQTKFKTKLRT